MPKASHGRLLKLVVPKYPLTFSDIFLSIGSGKMRMRHRATFAGSLRRAHVPCRCSLPLRKALESCKVIPGAH